MNQRINFFILLATLCVQAVLATPYNIAPQAKITASACIDEKHNAKNVADGTIRVPNQGDWAADSHVTFWGQIDYPWVKLEWNNAVSIDRVVLYDRPETDSHIAGGVLSFSDGTKINVWSIPNDG